MQNGDGLVASGEFDVEVIVSEALSREQALRVLSLGSTAAPADVKRAYRRLAREHHPDRGGDPGTFNEITRAFERLVDDEVAPRRPTMTRGRPSRPASGDVSTRADLASVDWSIAAPSTGSTLDRDQLAVALAQPAATPVSSVTATSRAPGSRWNRVAPHLAGHATAELSVTPDTDDRGRPVVAVQVRASARRARKALDRADLQGRWARMRGSSSTVLRSTLPLTDDPRATAVLAVDRAEHLLDALGWSLPAWTLTDGAG
jgi:hypothetical protein